jgi:hypothetical protein
MSIGYCVIKRWGNFKNFTNVWSRNTQYSLRNTNYAILITQYTILNTLNLYLLVLGF